MMAVSALALTLPTAAFGLGSLNKAEIRGKRVYTLGEGTQTVKAYLSGPEIEAPAKNFPCIQCHKENGTGAREGGVLAPDITFANLKTPVSGLRPTGRTHPPYNEKLLVRAIRKGIDPAGNPLQPAMPRYIINQKDLDDLIAYLKVLGREPVSGVTKDSIRVGTLLPSKGPLEKAGKVVQQVLSAYFEELNSLGGIYGRDVRLVTINFDPFQPGGALSALRKQFARKPVFCFLANLGLSNNPKARQWFRDENIPVFAPLTITPADAYILSNSTFYLYSSLSDQARVLVDFLAEDLVGTGKKIALLYAGDKISRDGALGVRKQLKQHDFSMVADQSYSLNEFHAEQWVTPLKKNGTQAVYFFGPGRDAREFVMEADRQGWHPFVFGSMELFGASLLSLPEQFDGKVYLASPLSLPDPKAEKLAAYFRLMKKYKIQEKFVAFQWSAFAGAVLLEKGLKVSGRDVTRHKLIKKAGNLWQVQTGVTSDLSFNENRRAGSIGASIILIDAKNHTFITKVPWREPQNN
ncbi:MAG: ABC transporter substrate-binding protein [Nitrospinaceae bacterium]